MFILLVRHHDIVNVEDEDPIPDENAFLWGEVGVGSPADQVPRERPRVGL